MGSAPSSEKAENSDDSQLSTKVPGGFVDDHILDAPIHIGNSRIEILQEPNNSAQTVEIIATGPTKNINSREHSVDLKNENSGAGYSIASTSESIPTQVANEESLSEGQPILPKGSNKSEKVGSIGRAQIESGDVVIAVMGITGSGKTTFVNHFADDQLQIGHTLEACTQFVQVVPCRLLDGQTIWLVDTPGFDDTYRTDTDILREIANWLTASYKNKIRLTGIIYLHRILDVRFGGTAVKNVRMLKKLCGKENLANVVLATTMWANVSEAIGSQREEELKSEQFCWKEMMERGSRVFRHHNKPETGYQIIKYLIDMHQPVTLDIQREMVDKKMDLIDTTAGAEVADIMETMKKKWEEEISSIRKELQEAIARRDDADKKELQQFEKELKMNLERDSEAMRKLQADTDQLHQQMAEKYDTEFKKLQEKIEEQEQQLQNAQNQTTEWKQKYQEDLEKSKKLRKQMQVQQAWQKSLYGQACVMM